MSKIKPSATLAINAKAAKMKAEGIDIISLGAGEPDFDTPENIKEAAVQAILDGYTKYTDVSGLYILKEAVAAKFQRENNLNYNLDEIIISSGGKQLIYNAFMSTIDPGDEVIIPIPYWVSYPDIVMLAGGVPRFANCSLENFKLSAQDLEHAITEKTKWLIINSPSNPTGSVYNKSELEGLAEVLRKHSNIYILSDDIYEHILYSDFEFLNILQVAPDLKPRVLIANGVSKTYAMTGWRIGFGAGPKELIKNMAIIQSQSTSCPSSISQMAAVEALRGKQDFIKPNALGFQRKRDLLISLFQEIDNIECDKPEGAFYLFASCKKFFGYHTPDKKFFIKDCSDFCTYLLEYGHVAVVPGIAFGMEGCFRASYATSEQVIADACMRIKDACQRLQKP